MTEEFVIWLIDYFGSIVLGLAVTPLTVIGELIPDSLNAYIEGGVAYLPIINVWCPIDVGATLWIIYMTMKSGLIIIKWVLKGCPWIWG